jgi:pyruvate dehydrogenase E2 component (dihydrolipoamide acetyltransferase)
MIEFTLPALGSDMDEGNINEWLVHPGDTVTRGQVVAVVETGKANVEVECWQDGTVAEILVPTGRTIPVGTVLATLYSIGETPSPTATSTAVTSTTATPTAGTPTAGTPTAGTPTAGTPTNHAVVEPPAAAAANPPEPRTRPILSPAAPAADPHRWVSPAARRHARLRGLNLDLVRGTGVGGSVTLADVQATLSHQPRPHSDVLAGRLANLREDTAAILGRAQRDIPHYYLTQTFSVAVLLDWLQQRNSGQQRQVIPAVAQLKAVAAAARKYPDLNGHRTDTHFEPSRDVHVGVTIPLNHGGVVAPCIRRAADKPLEQLAAELSDLVVRARTGRLRGSELTEPTITITDLGEHAVDTVTGVIFEPQVALVGFGAVTVRPWAQDGRLVAEPTMTMTLAADHRVSDGHRGALFLAEIQRLLQHPAQL